MIYLLLAVVFAFTIGFFTYIAFSKKKLGEVKGGENILPEEMRGSKMEERSL